MDKKLKLLISFVASFHSFHVTTYKLSYTMLFYILVEAKLGSRSNYIIIVAIYNVAFLCPFLICGSL